MSEDKGHCSQRDMAARRHMKPLQELPCICTLAQWYKCRRPECLRHANNPPMVDRTGGTILDAG